MKLRFTLYIVGNHVILNCSLFTPHIEVVEGRQQGMSRSLTPPGSCFCCRVTFKQKQTFSK